MSGLSDYSSEATEDITSFSCLLHTVGSNPEMLSDVQASSTFCFE